MATIFSADIADSDIRNHVADVEKLVATHGGEIVLTDVWGMRDFAYPIKKKKSGYYVFYYFDAPRETPHKLRDAIRLREDVIRHMILVNEYMPERKGKEVQSGTTTEG
jgi:small subunit ribosomal protein S6